MGTIQEEWELLRESGYTVGECFYQGNFSKICKTLYEVKGQEPLVYPPEPKSLACKIIEKDTLPHHFVRKLLPMQLEVMSRLTHEHIVSIHSILASGVRYYIFMEACEVGNLFDFCKRHGPLTLDLAKYWYRQLLEAVAYCHSVGISHRNLTVKNILITANREVRLSGFDFSTLFSRLALNRTTCGTTYYIPPEILAGVPYDSTKGDVWCLGIILIYILTRIYPFPVSKPAKLLKFQQAGLRKSIAWTAVRKLPDECVDLIQKCLKLNPHHRPTVHELLKHAWLTTQNEALVESNRQSRRVAQPPPPLEPPKFEEKEARMSMAIVSGIVNQLQQLNDRKVKALQILADRRQN